MKKKNAPKRIAILVANGFEQSEFEKPLKALQKAGANVEVLSLEKGKVKAWKNKDWGKTFKVDQTVAKAKASNYDGLVLPGGVMNPDQLRTNAAAVGFVKAFGTQHKPIAAICHGPWTLIEAGLVKGKTLTSYPSLKTDLTNAGAKWVDKKVVEDRNIITSRNPNDLPAFCKKMLKAFGIR